MVSSKRVATTGCLLLCLGGCGSVALQPGGTAGADGGAAGAAGGATGTAGSAPAGHGGSGAAGQTGAGGSMGTAGSPGTVALFLNVPSSSSFCDMSCGGVGQHITILTTDGKPVPLQPPSCLAMCTAGTCQPNSCPVGGACLLIGVAVSGAELKWDGTTYPTSTCGGGGACYRSTFVPAGKYIAHMCATPGTLSLPADSPPVCTFTGVQACTDVTFTLPGQSVVEGTLDGVAPTCGSIRASDYDQSCKVNSDCVVVPQGDFCQTNVCTNCPTAALSAHAEMVYRSDLASRILAPSVCPCPAPRAPVCSNFKCVL